MNFAIIIGLALVFFIGYIGYQIFAHKGNSRANVSTKNSDDLSLIAQNKEIQLINETKRIQTVAQKNQLFKRSFINKFGAEALNYTPDEPEWSAKTVPLEKLPANEIYSLEENLFSDSSIESQMAENEMIEISKLSDLTEDLNSLSLDELSMSESMNTQKQNLEDSYTDSQLFEIECLYNTYKSFYN